jgi:large subunit ribosomal protein L34
MPQTKRTYQPKKRKRMNKHGWLKRMSSPGGKNVIKRRKGKGRKKLVVHTKLK